MTITEFLTARLDEAEATTRRQDERWYVCNDGHVATPTAQEVDGTDHLPNHHNTWDVMYDPEWVRADIAAKRAILARYEAWNMGADDGHPVAGILLGVVQDLTSVYSDHPDYKQEWKP